MTRGQTLVIIAIISISSIWPIVAYAHPVGSCLGNSGGCSLRGWDERYSTNVLDMNNDAQKVLIINGSIENLNKDKVRLVPYVSVDALKSSPFGSFELNNLLRLFYPLYNDPASWYFRVESNLSQPLVLEPHDRVGYEVRAYPLKAGVYHVHLAFVFDYLNDGRYRYYQSTGRGETMTVIGATTPTMGEVTQLILPFAIGATIIPITVLKARRVAKNDNQNSKMRKEIRLYFAVKVSVETVWLAGLLLWFFFAAYPAFHSLESRILSMIGMIALIAAITVSGYTAAIAKSKKIQNIFAIGTAIASIIVYNLLGIVSFYAFWHGGGIPFYYDLLPTSGVGYNYNAFEPNNYLAYLAALAANAVVAVMSAFMRREKYNTKVIAGFAAGIVAFVFFVTRVL